jgi:hypothetical protein
MLIPIFLPVGVAVLSQTGLKLSWPFQFFELTFSP